MQPTKVSRARRVTALTLLGCMLLQPALTYLVTPWMAKNADGMLVVMCTLKGQRSAFVDVPAELHDQTGEQQEHCPAVKLFQLASSVQVSAPLRTPDTRLRSIDFVGQTLEQTQRDPHFSAYLTRAPPHA